MSTATHLYDFCLSTTWLWVVVRGIAILKSASDPSGAARPISGVLLGSSPETAVLDL